VLADPFDLCRCIRRPHAACRADRTYTIRVLCFGVSAMGYAVMQGLVRRTTRIENMGLETAECHFELLEPAIRKCTDDDCAD
jgi:hypothetical protein